MLDFSDLHIIVAGDVCDDVILVGEANRLARDAPACPVVDVTVRETIAGGAAFAHQQVTALGASAFLVPTGPSAAKSRLYASREGQLSLLARWDDAWKPQDPRTFNDLLAAAPPANALVYSQVRRGRPDGGIIRLCRDFDGLRVADAHHPAFFAGFDVLKIGLDDAWASLSPPRPPQTAERIAEAASVLAETYGYRLVVITMGRLGYCASIDSARICEQAIDPERGVATSGAGDVFTATLAVALAGNVEARHALRLANAAAGLACRWTRHLATVSIEEISKQLEGVDDHAP